MKLEKVCDRVLKSFTNYLWKAAAAEQQIITIVILPREQYNPLFLFDKVGLADNFSPCRTTRAHLL